MSSFHFHARLSHRCLLWNVGSPPTPFSSMALTYTVSQALGVQTSLASPLAGAIFLTEHWHFLHLMVQCLGTVRVVCRSVWVCKHVLATHGQEDLQSLLGRLGDHLQLKTLWTVVAWAGQVELLLCLIHTWTGQQAMQWHLQNAIS